MNQLINQQLFAEDLIHWYENNKRNLPWRKTNNPYYIWISEVMLQQTQVDTVIPYYNRFITEFPTPAALAKADENNVLKLWEGLGYYSRARNLWQGVREVSETYDGKVPENKKELLSIKGVGPYTAGALLSIAYGQAEPAVDGNVMRVMSRVLLIDDDIAKQKTRKLFEKIVKDIIPDDGASSFNQGLMELGALICKPKNPACEICPVKQHCDAFVKSLQQDYPVKKKKTKVREKHYAVLLCRNNEGHVFINQRPSEGLLANMWELPMIEVSDATTQKTVIKDFEKFFSQNDFNCTDIELTHMFSHLKWRLRVVTMNNPSDLSGFPQGNWVKPSELNHYPFPVSHQKLLKKTDLQSG